MKTHIRLFVGVWAFLAAGTVFGQGKGQQPHVCMRGGAEVKTVKGKKIERKKTCEKNGGTWELKKSLH